jgi:hypothetical protein
MKEADEQANGHDAHVSSSVYVLSKKTDKISRPFARFQIKYVYIYLYIFLIFSEGEHVTVLTERYVGYFSTEPLESNILSSPRH